MGTGSVSNLNAMNNMNNMNSNNMNNVHSGSRTNLNTNRLAMNGPLNNNSVQMVGNISNSGSYPNGGIRNTNSMIAEHGGVDNYNPAMSTTVSNHNAVNLWPQVCCKNIFFVLLCFTYHFFTPLFFASPLSNNLFSNMSDYRFPGWSTQCVWRKWGGGRDGLCERHILYHVQRK